MNTMRLVPENDPIRIAWDKYKATEEYANAKNWATHEKHTDGSLWAAFIMGWSASDAARAQKQRDNYDEHAEYEEDMK